MVLAIEPMVNAGGPEVALLGDGWTVVTVDHSLSAYFEHSVAITADGPEVLTTLGKRQPSSTSPDGESTGQPSSRLRGVPDQSSSPLRGGPDQSPSALRGGPDETPSALRGGPERGAED
jgi:hypothetical protein